MTDAKGEGAVTSRMPIRYDPGINLGHLLTVAAIIGSVTFAAGLISSRTDSNQKQMDQLESKMTSQMTGMQSQMTSQMTSMESKMTAGMVALQADNAAKMARLEVTTEKQLGLVRDTVNNIPSMTERVSQLEKTVEWRAKMQDQDHSATIENTTNMNNYLRGIGAGQKIPK